MFYKTYYSSPIGKLLIASDEDNIVGLWIEGQKYYLNTLSVEPILNDKVDILVKAKKWLDRYFNLENPDIKELQIAPIGGKFRQRVWRKLCEIPYGEVCTYGTIAKKIAKEMGKKSMSAQAIGGAVGHNQISIIIPCHRVVGTNGNLTGYAGGIDKKMQLLEMESNGKKKITIDNN